MPLMEITGGKNLRKQTDDAVSPVVVGKRTMDIKEEIMETKRKKGELYCVCAEAEKATCEACEKGKRLNPDHIINNPAWPRK